MSVTSSAIKNAHLENPHTIPYILDVSNDKRSHSNTIFTLRVNKHTAYKVQQTIVKRKTASHKNGKILRFGHVIRNLKYVLTVMQAML